MTLHNVIIHIKSVVNKDKNHHYYKTFLKKYSYQIDKKQLQFSFHSFIMLRFGDAKIAKEKCYAPKITLKN